jgi:hypothetical protein
LPSDPNETERRDIAKLTGEARNLVRIETRKKGVHKMADSGILYVLTNPFMPALVKIGHTTGSVEDRIKELSQASGVPVAFKCHFAAEVNKMTAKERMLHRLFADKRTNPKREFFEVAPEKVVLAIKMGPHKEVTPGKPDLPTDEEDAFEKAEEAETRRRSRLQLRAIGIHPGAKLTFTRDKNTHATVVAGNKVKLDGQILSIAAAAKLALKKVGKNWPTVQGSLYWKYKGNTLDEIRRTKE